MATSSADPASPAVRAAWASGDFEKATTEALREYGAELFGFLVSMHGDYDVASEAFAVFSERLWQTMRRFEWECSLRTWCYRLARNAAIDQHRAARGKRQVGLSNAPEVFEMAAQVRSATMSALRTANRTALERLRGARSRWSSAAWRTALRRSTSWRSSVKRPA
jgi:RNA polymerase sigma-70 factor, ECF subfamily